MTPLFGMAKASSTVRPYGRLLLFLLHCSMLCFGVWARPVIAQSPAVFVLDTNRVSHTALADGNAINLQVTVASGVSVDTSVEFLLDGTAAPIGRCTIPSGQTNCETARFPAYGWAWDDAGGRQPARVVRAESAGQLLGTSAPLTITPRPVVMVHGFAAASAVWSAYLGDGGFLRTNDLQGFAVGDGQVAGVMNVGDKRAPLTPTNTIAQNAEVLRAYIRNVQQVTGAEQVDLLVHSMGGIIARYYLDRLMPARNVAQLIVLGSPMGGSSCSVLPVALGLMLPASLELQPHYMQQIFNPQISRRQGVPFHALGGTQLLDAVQSPCTNVPSDLVVSLASIHAIPMPVAEMPLLHPTLNDDPAVFTDFVLPLLQSPPATAWQVADPSAAASSTTPGQFTRVYTGHLQPGETNDLIINIDPGVTVATFALYDSSRSLTTTVTGANGNTIQLDAVANGEIRVTDAEMMVYLGYGFVQPRAGQWIVTLQSTADTPAAGADYAITAQFHGGATLQTTVDQLLPAVNQPVTVQAQLTAAGQPIALTAAEANVRQPDGQLTTYPLVMAGATATLTLAPAQSGLYGVEVSVRAQTVDGLTIDRASFTLFEAQPTLIEARFRLGSALPFLLFLVFILLLPLILLVVFVL